MTAKKNNSNEANYRIEQTSGRRAQSLVFYIHRHKQQTYRPHRLRKTKRKRERRSFLSTRQSIRRIDKE